METEKTKFETTDTIRALLTSANQIEEGRAGVCKPIGFFYKRYDHEAIIELSKACAEAKSRLWTAIHQVYPETKSGSWTCGDDFITKL